MLRKFRILRRLRKWVRVNGEPALKGEQGDPQNYSWTYFWVSEKDSATLAPAAAQNELIIFRLKSARVLPEAALSLSRLTPVRNR